MPKVSIILVHFGKKKILSDCVRSIHASKPKTSYEIIIVDNNKENRGYSKGNNLGVEKAKGEYVLILNPDTIIQKGTIDKLVSFLQKKMPAGEARKKVGIVAPTLYDKKGKVYPLQGSKKLTPIRGIFALSFINKIWPNNPISKKYWLSEVNRTKPFEVDVVPGTAFLIKKDLFNKVGGFDENFFLYFEESDFCNRIKKLSYKLFIIPDAKTVHIWGASTPPSEKISKIFAESRYYYFKKNYGILNAILVEFFARLNKWNLMLIGIIALGTFLRFYKIQQNLIFNGEMGYDYMTIRDFVEKHQIPLIGPRTSHEWFFIGPLFYWLFGILLPLFNYDVRMGAYFFAIIGVATIPVCYWVIKNLFDKKTAIISSFLISFSPLWVNLAHDARFNGVTALLFFPFFYLLVRSIEDKGRSLFLLGLTLGIMFSFFPSPILLLPGSLIVLFIYRKNLERKYFIPGVVGLIIPVIPWLLYNAQHKFDLLTNILIWIPYRILGFFGLYHKNTVSPQILQSNFSGLYTFFQGSYLPQNNILIFILFVIVLGFTTFRMKRDISTNVLLILSIVSYLGLFVHGDPPEHYYLVIYPVPIILLSLFLTQINKKFLTVLVLGGLLIFNLKYYFSNQWFFVDSTKVSADHYYVPYKLQLAAADFIVKDAGSNSFALSRVGPYDYFGENFSLNYQYLLRNLGKKPDPNAKLRYTIYDDATNLPAGEKVFWIQNLAITKNE